MKKLSEKELVNFIEPNVQAFHDRRIENLNRLNLTTVLKRKNPYFYEHYAQVLNKFTHKFIDRFCLNGRIAWDKLVEFNSAKII